MLPWHRCLLIELNHKNDMTLSSNLLAIILDDAGRKRFSKKRRKEAYHIDAGRERIIPLNRLELVSALARSPLTISALHTVSMRPVEGPPDPSR